MGAFALAYPKPFLHGNQFGSNVASLCDQLENSIAKGATAGNVLFVVDVVVPVVTRYVYVHVQPD